MVPSSLSLLQKALDEQLLILDGAMGTVLQGHHLAEEEFRGEELAGHDKTLSGNFDFLTLTRPDLIETVHRAYINAGADIICTNTLNSNRVMQVRYGTDALVERLNMEAADLARRTIDEYLLHDPDRRVFIAGVIGPTDAVPSDVDTQETSGFRHIERDTLIDAWRVQAGALIRGGVDILLVETMFHTAGMAAACEAVGAALHEAGAEIPLWISATPNKEGTGLLGGESIRDFVTTAEQFEPFCIGFNCGWGVVGMVKPLQDLTTLTGTALALYPSAGIPDENGIYPDDPEMFASAMREIAESGLLNVVGGCCGTTPEHIRSLVREVDGLPSRPL